MKILSAQQIREADAHTIQHEPISSIDLMERAARACALRITSSTPRLSNFYVFCGKGNNGGDGLAIARMLAAMKRKAEVFLIEHSEKETRDFAVNLKRLEIQHLVQINVIHKISEIKLDPKKNTFIIDALLGTGINKPVEGLLAETIGIINNSALPVIAVDVPSGLFCDVKPVTKHIVKAWITLTFQRPKYTFLFTDCYSYTGSVEILDIGLDERSIEAQSSTNFLLDEHDLHQLIKHRSQIAHKGNFGHALLLAGSKGMIGAALLASRACLRSGAGLLTTHLPACGYEIIQTALPEAIISSDTNEEHLSACPTLEKYSAIAIGPGIGNDKETAQALKVLIQQAAVSLVLDADAINILSQNKTWISFVPPNTIITPHPKEFDRLVGTHSSGFDRLESCKEFAKKNNIIVILKGAHTAIVSPDGNVFFNSTGNAALAKGGSGDVLTGILLGLLARGYEPLSACKIAVYMHGRAADLYVKKFSEESMLATDLIELLPIAFTSV